MKNRVIWLTAVLLIGLIGFSPGYAAPGDNLLINGSFETGDDTSWGGYGGHTRTVVQTLVGAAVPDDPVDGDYCLYVVVPAAGANFWDAGIQVWQGETFEAGKKYTLSAFFKSKSGSLEINFKPELGVDPWTAYGEQMMTITEEWAEYSVTTPVFGADTTPASLTWHIAMTAGEFWVDAVRWYEGDYVPPEFEPQTKATQPVPANGDTVPPVVFESNVYLTLDYKPGEGAITHTGYFSDVEQDVIDRDAGHSLGNPPYPGVDPEMFYVGFDAPEVAPFARTPLERGKTYYWAIDESNGVSTAAGDVWSFTVMLLQAWNPDPYDGEGFVATAGTMTWSLGDQVTGDMTLSYNIYIGTDEAAVAAVATGDTTSPLYAGTVDAETYDFSDLDPEAEQSWRVDTSLALTRPPFTQTITKGDVWTFTTAPPGVGSILREVWNGIGGTAITDLTNDPRYPDSPDSTELLPLFQGPIGAGDDYGSRIHGWLVVGQTGDYTFWIASDDNGELWLSTDLSPTNAVLISQTTSWANPLQFDDPAVIPSDPIHLEGGQQYYISGLMKEGSGGDNIAVAWQGPDTGGVRQVIPGNHLKPFVPLVAANPDPANNSSDAPLSVTLSWDAGTDETTGLPYTDQHVYVGSGPIAVANATTSSPEYKGAPTGLDEYGPLTLGYYEQVFWRIDGETSTTGLVTYQGDVWNFRAIVDPAWASNPDPPDGEIDVQDNPTLSWTPGAGATAHTIYFGADDPGNMVIVAGPQGGTTYAPPTLDLGTTYYWRIVESPGMGQGITWSFTTSQSRVVDDMESYTPWTTPGNNIFEAWRDAEGNCDPGNGNNTGSILTETTDPLFVRSGFQSMKYEFDNDGTVFSPCDSIQEPGRLMYSKIEAQVAGLASGIGTNWARGGVKALRLHFMGQPGNATTESLWVQLQDSSKTYGTKVFYGDFEGESLDDFNDASWHEWNIDMGDFGVDLENVVSIVIGIGDESKATAGGSGTLYFDDIRLYVPQCVPQRAKPAADFDNSCQVDYADVDALFGWWLFRDIPETAWDGTWLSADIGDVNVAGSFADLGGDVYTITARGDDIWNAADAFRYAYQSLSGDGQLTVRVTDIGGPSTNDWRKAGVMIRETLDADSPHAFMTATPTLAGGNGESFQWRPSKGAISSSSNISAGVSIPTCVRIVRVGDTFRGFYYDGSEWVQEGPTVTIPMAENVYIGMAVTSHEVNISCTATFDRACSTDFLPMDLAGVDKVINFYDYAEVMNQWMDVVEWPQ